MNNIALQIARLRQKLDKGHLEWISESDLRDVIEFLEELQRACHVQQAVNAILKGD